MSDQRQRLDDDEVHRLLDALGRSAAGEQAFVEKVGRLVAAEASVEPFVSAVERRLGPRRRRRWPLLLAPLLAAAAIALWSRPPRPRAPVSVPAKLLTGTLAWSGARLRPGQIVPQGAALASDEGRACLALPDGTGLCLERATRVRLGPGRVALEAGKAAAAVAHQRPGATFAIASAAGEVTAVGTAFSVELGGAGMITRIVEGIVRVERAGAGPVLLPAHEALSTTDRWRMSSEEERDEWSLLRAQTAPALLARHQAPPPAEAHPPSDDAPALLRLADALRARGRLRDAQGICDDLHRRHPGRPEIERLAAELRLPAPAQPWNATPAVYRINAGGDRYVDPRGNVWAADSHFTGGHAVEIAEEIDATDMDPLYRTERWIFPGERLAYNLPVADGRYVVRLHFAEIWAGTIKSNMRRFDVLVEGEKVLAGYDIAAEVGPMTATVEQIVTEVHDGSLDIELEHVVENPKISAIEVFALEPGAPPPPAPARPAVFPPLPLPPTDALYRVNAGGREYVDPQGRRWEADSYFNDSGLGAARYVDIAGTELDPLYQTEHRGWVLPSRPGLVYTFPVPPGRYLVRLHFAELDPAAAVGREVFDVVLGKAVVLPALDVFAEAGLRNALVKEVTATVGDGSLELSFRPIAGRPKVSAIEVLPAVVVAPPPGGGCAVGGGPPVGFAWLVVLLLLSAGISRLARSGFRQQRPHSGRCSSRDRAGCMRRR